MKKPEQTLTLSQCTGMLARIARGWLSKHDAYYCTVGGKRTKVVADADESERWWRLEDARARISATPLDDEDDEGRLIR